MISHKHKCIFIHIPKTAGTSINTFFHPGVKFHYKTPDYERLFGWCPKRQLHMQHATAKQLLETELITQEQWDNYYKFTFVRNPWDRAYSDYLWIMNDRKVKGTFSEYLNKQGGFKEIFTNQNNADYRGDHLWPQTDFFDLEGPLRLDYIGKFENFPKEINFILKELQINKTFDSYENRQEKLLKHYSDFYNRRTKRLVENVFKNDIQLLKYDFNMKTPLIYRLKQLF
jgi:Txe/YoeB family toxin of Txe-Axe toxin-antitoxin module